MPDWSRKLLSAIRLQMSESEEKFQATFFWNLPFESKKVPTGQPCRAEQMQGRYSGVARQNAMDPFYFFRQGL